MQINWPCKPIILLLLPFLQKIPTIYEVFNWMWSLELGILIVLLMINIQTIVSIKNHGHAKPILSRVGFFSSFQWLPTSKLISFGHDLTSNLYFHHMGLFGNHKFYNEKTCCRFCECYLLYCHTKNWFTWIYCLTFLDPNYAMDLLQP